MSNGFSLKRIPIDAGMVLGALEDILIEKSGKKDQAPEQVVHNTLTTTIDFVLWLLGGSIAKGRSIPQNPLVIEAVARAAEKASEGI